MRRLLLLVCALVAVDTMLYAALTPLLPHFAHHLHLSKAGAGVLVAAYAAGALVGGLPGGLATARLGARRAVFIGLALMGLSSLAFAFVHGFWPLAAARFAQGCGSGFTWAGAFALLLAGAPRERRGEVIGTALGAAVFGALFGPVVGAGAALLGRGVVFTAVAGLAVLLAVWTLRVEPIPPRASFDCSRQPRAPELVLRGRTRLDGAAVVALGCALHSRAAPARRLRLGSAGHRCRLARRRRVRDRSLAARRANARPPWRVDSRASRARSRRRGLGRPRGGPTAAALRAAPDRCVRRVRRPLHAGIRLDRRRCRAQPAFPREWPSA